MWILSIDCAVTNLAFGIIFYNESWREDIRNASAIAASVISKNIFRIEWLAHVNLIPGKRLAKSTSAERTRALRTAMSMIRQYLHDHNIVLDHVLIEYQMGQNNKTVIVANQIMYEWISEGAVIAATHTDSKFACTPGLTNAPSIPSSKTPKVWFVGPSLKNQVNFPNVRYQDFVSRYTNYVANKKHAVANLYAYLALFDPTGHILRVFAKEKLDDIADVVMMCFGWLRSRGY
jgi:hypothetical protein